MGEGLQQRNYLGIAAQIVLRVRAGDADFDGHCPIREDPKHILIRQIVADGHNEIVLFFNDPFQSGTSLIDPGVSDFDHFAPLPDL